MTIIGKHLEFLWQYHRDEPILDDDSGIVDFPDDPDRASFKYKQAITWQ